MSSAISLIATVTSSGTASPGPALDFDVFFWYMLVTVEPFLVVSWRRPNTYPMGGVRRGTATQIPRDPGQPRIEAQRQPARPLMPIRIRSKLLTVEGIGRLANFKLPPSDVATNLRFTGAPSLLGKEEVRKWKTLLSAQPISTS
jgi:hypothetical protein